MLTLWCCQSPDQAAWTALTACPGRSKPGANPVVRAGESNKPPVERLALCLTETGKPQPGAQLTGRAPRVPGCRGSRPCALPLCARPSLRAAGRPAERAGHGLPPAARRALRGGPGPGGRRGPGGLGLGPPAEPCPAARRPPCRAHCRRQCRRSGTGAGFGAAGEAAGSGSAEGTAGGRLGVSGPRRPPLRSPAARRGPGPAGRPRPPSSLLPPPRLPAVGPAAVPDSPQPRRCCGPAFVRQEPSRHLIPLPREVAFYCPLRAPRFVSLFPPARLSLAAARLTLLPLASQGKGHGKQILVLGLDGAGKTSVLHSLATNHVKRSVAPTEGFNAICINTEESQMEFLEIGGSESLRSYWKMYLPKVLLLIYVVDSADHARLPVAKQLLHQLIQNDSTLPVVVLANKQDLEGAFCITDIHDALALSDLGDERKMFLIGTHVAEDGSEISSSMKDAKELIAQLVLEAQ
uniref:ADP ribosylation factor like GTPase 9 n=1 Tax=Calidris pygmaea TaxID=425635 RepID=A0A8C3JEC6_9CHAR